MILAVLKTLKINDDHYRNMVDRCIRILERTNGVFVTEFTEIAQILKDERSSDPTYNALEVRYKAAVKKANLYPCSSAKDVTSTGHEFNQPLREALNFDEILKKSGSASM